MEILIAVIALAIAWWQLDLNKKEIERSGKINALVNMSQMLRERIELYGNIIDSQKAQGKPWKGHADTVNKELRPLLEKINQELIETSKNYKLGLSSAEIIKALNLKERTKYESVDG